MASKDSESAGSTAPDLEKRVEERFGVLPNFFCLAPETPEITEKLWGLRFRYGMMHDGDSPGTDVAIMRHGGEATMVRHRYEHLTAKEKQQLQSFLNSL
jgi:hypothetical protein